MPSSWSKMSHFEVTACAWTSSGSTVSHLDGTNPAGICLAEELETLFLDDGVWTSRGIPSTSEFSSAESFFTSQFCDDEPEKNNANVNFWTNYPGF